MRGKIIPLDEGAGVRVAVVGPAYPLRGGNALFVAHLVDSLSSDHDVYVVSYSRLYPSLLFPGKTQMNLSRDPVKTTASRQLIDSISPVSWVRAARWMAVPARRPALVIFTWWNPFFGPCLGVIARLMKRWTGAGIVFVAENVVSHENRFVDRFLTRFALSAADYFLVLSGVVASRIQCLFPGIPVRQAALPIYNCYRNQEGLQRGERPTSRKQELQLDRPQVLFFGYVREYKGLKYLIEAMPAVLAQVDVDLMIVGEFYDDRDHYERLIDTLGIRQRVTVVAEHVPDEAVGRYFGAADLVVLPYVSATQSGIAQIAYAFGVPVVSTNVGGLPEVVADGKTGYIVSPGDPEALAEAIVRFFTSGDAERMRSNVKDETRRDRAGELMRRAVRDFIEMESTQRE
jgi:glycosyltransferase involved in cell wall biosynthesis